MGIAHAQIRLWSRQEYERLAAQGVFAPGERVELIEGEIVAVTPQGTLHAAAIMLVQAALLQVFQTGHVVCVQLPLALGLRSMPEPDFAVVPGSPRNYRDAHPTTAVLVVEVADTTLEFDRIEKSSMYAAAGILDYWVLNLVDRVLEVYRDPGRQPGSPFGHGYRTYLHFGPADRVAPLSAPNAFIAVANLHP